jgi:hypothetical protein
VSAHLQSLQVLASLLVLSSHNSAQAETGATAEERQPVFCLRHIKAERINNCRGWKSGSERQSDNRWPSWNVVPATGRHRDACVALSLFRPVPERKAVNNARPDRDSCLAKHWLSLRGLTHPFVAMTKFTTRILSAR